MLVRGAGETIIIDPSVTVVARGGAPVAVDAVVNSHSHEDHMAGNGLFPDARVHIHDADLVGAQSIDGLMAVYGLTGTSRREFEAVVIERVPLHGRVPTPRGSTDGHVFDLGGGVRVEAVHLPGHTRGHSGFRIGDVFFLSDIDLTGFGPYYGDVWSDLDDFEASLERVRDEQAAFYVTFHHKGVIEGREAVRRTRRRLHRGDRPAARRDARVPRRTALHRRDGRAPVHLPAARRVGVRPTRSSGAAPTSTSQRMLPAAKRRGRSRSTSRL